MKPSDQIDAQPSEWPEADSYHVPHLIAEWDGDVCWGVSFTGDAPPVTDKHGETHRPVPCYTRPTVERLVADLRAENASLRAQLAGRSARCGDERYELDAYIWKRRDEWVLELSGTINDCFFITRHTEPATTPPEEAVGLPTLYSQLAGRVAVPEGWKLVPRITTDKMRDAGVARYIEFGDENGGPYTREGERQQMQAVFAAMLAAAPEPVQASPSLPEFTEAERAALLRCDETMADDSTYDVPAEMMQRLAHIGAVRRLVGNYYEITEFGAAMVERFSADAHRAQRKEGE